MVELADIFREHGPAYREKYGEKILPSHRRAMADIEQCRTEALGAHVYQCGHCNETHCRYHSCKNRHCPKCQGDAAKEWLQKQQQFLLPTPYHMVTFTLPSELRDVARLHQKEVYNLLFRTSATALQQLALDPRFVGGQLGMMSVLHTWTRDLLYHPHVHLLVPAGGISPDGKSWRPCSKDFLVHVMPLSILFQAKFRDGLKKCGLYDQVPASAWDKSWVVHSKPVGNGSHALNYLSHYLFRVAISNKRILSMHNGNVTFEYKESGSGTLKTRSLPAEAFIQRFLQHVLPKGFVKVRYYGFFGTTKRDVLKQLRTLFLISNPAQMTIPSPEMNVSFEAGIPCPNCGQTMRLVEVFRPSSRCPP